MRNQEDFDAEIEAHIALEADRLVAEGMPPHEAQLAARRVFGNRTRVRERFHEGQRWPWGEQLLQDVHYAVRGWMKRPGLAGLVVVSLAVGIGANTAIFSVMNTLLLKALPYRDADRLMYVTEYWPKEPMVPGPPSPDFAHWRAHSQLVEAMAGYGGGAAMTLTGAREPERVQGTSVTHNLLPLLGTQLAHGRSFRADEDRPGAPPVAILGYALWQRRFGGREKAVGQTITLNGSVRTIVGVLPAGFRFPDNNFQEELLVPMALPAEPEWRENFRFLRVLVRAKAGVAPEAVREEFTSLLRANAAKEPAPMALMRRDLEVRVTRLREWLTGKVKPMVLGLQVAVAMVLLIAALNVASLQVALGISRRKELALRASIGAGPGRLVRQLLAESLLLSMVGGGVGVAVAYGGLSGLRSFLPATLRLADTIRVDGEVLAFALLLTLAVGVCTGLIPAWTAARIPGARIPLERALREGQGQTTGGRAPQRLLGALVVAEVAVAMVLLAGAGLLARSLIRLVGESPGFEPAGVMTLKVAPSPRRYPEAAKRVALYQELLERGRAIPGVQVAAVGGGLPLVGSPGAAGVSFEDRPEPPVGGRPSIPVAFVSADYFRALGIPVLRGRAFTQAEGAGSPLVAIVNQAFAEAYFPGESALGKRIEFGSREERWREIVGVVGNVRQLGTRPTDALAVYGTLASSFETEVFLVLKSGQAAGSLAGAAGQMVREVDANEPVFDVSSMEQRLRDSQAGPRATVTLMSAFAGLALLLANVGILGVVTYFVSRRRQEIGIRMALGATAGDVMGAVFWRGIALVLAGVIAGTAGALAVTRALGARLAGLGEADPWTLGGLAAVFLLVAAIACWVPARWAAQAEPASVLRQG